MKSRELQNLGIPAGEPVRLAMPAIGEAMKGGMTRADVRTKIREIVGKPEDHVSDLVFGKMAASMIQTVAARAHFEERAEPTAGSGVPGCRALPILDGGTNGVSAKTFLTRAGGGFRLFRFLGKEKGFWQVLPAYFLFFWTRIGARNVYALVFTLTEGDA